MKTLAKTTDKLSNKEISWFGLVNGKPMTWKWKPPYVHIYDKVKSEQFFCTKRKNKLANNYQYLQYFA